MSREDASRIERTLAADAPALHARAPRFDPAELPEALPGAVRAWLERSLVPGEPAPRLARLEVRGEIRLGRWLPFRAVETLDPHRGFCWRAKVGWGPLRIEGFDAYLEGEGVMDWRAYGLVPIARATGADIGRSNRERCRAEAVFVPGALHPGWGVSFREAGAWEVDARWTLDGEDAPLRLRIGPDGLLRRVALRRWGAPDGGPFVERWFVAELAEHRREEGLLVPGRWEVGWADEPGEPADVVLRGTTGTIAWPA